MHSIASSPRLNGFTTRSVVQVNHPMQFAGTFGPGDYPVFRANDLKSLSEDAFHKVLRSFEKNGLIDRSVREGDDDEGTQTLYSVTSKGALVHYARVQTREARVPGTVDWLRRSSQR